MNLRRDPASIAEKVIAAIWDYGLPAMRSRLPPKDVREGGASRAEELANEDQVVDIVVPLPGV